MELHVSGVPADAAAKLLVRVQAVAHVRHGKQHFASRVLQQVRCLVQLALAVEAHVAGVPAGAAGICTGAFEEAGF